MRVRGHATNAPGHCLPPKPRLFGFSRIRNRAEGDAVTVPDRPAPAADGAAYRGRIHAPQTIGRSLACCPLVVPPLRPYVPVNLMSRLPSPEYTRFPLFVQGGTAIAYALRCSTLYARGLGHTEARGPKAGPAKLQRGGSVCPLLCGCDTRPLPSVSF